MNEDKFMTLWTKYLPVIRILLKKSMTEEQQVAIGKMELQSVDNRKNANYNFNLEIIKGKVENSIGSAAIGKDLFKVLTMDSTISMFMSDKVVFISMGKTCQLKLKANTVELV